MTIKYRSKFRLLASIITVSLLMGIVPETAFAADCPHKWIVAERNVDVHVQSCSLCGESKTDTHIYSTAEQSCTYENDDYHSQTCTVCAQIHLLPHGIKGSTTMGGWEGGWFWNWCRGCNKNAADKEYADAYHATELTNCSSHVYTVLSYTGDGHIQECRLCGVTKEQEAHNWTSIDTATGTTICSAGCRAIIEGAGAPDVPAEFPVEYYFSQKGPYTTIAQEFSDFTDPEGQFNHIKIWYPAEITTTDGQWPVIVFCNGTGSAYGPNQNGETQTDEEGYTALFEHFASWGFILVANNRPGCASSTATDTSLGYLLDRNKVQGDLFYDKVDMTRIGIAGHSQGGTAVLQNLSGSTVTNDVNITYKYANLYSAAWSASPQAYDNILKWTYTPENIETPTFMVCADNDWASSANILSTNISKMGETVAVMAVRKNADHGAMVSIGKGYMIAWFRYVLLDDSYAAEAFVNGGELFFNNMWQNQAASFLSD